MSRQQSRDASSPLIYGALPRAQLMPPEVALRRRESSRRRGLIALVAVVLVLVVGGIVATYWLAAAAQQRLEAERAVTQQLLAEQLEYVEVLGIQERLEAVVAQRDALAGVEVLWQDELQPYLAVLDSNEVVEAVNAEGNTPFEPPLAQQGPLRSARSATVLLTVATVELPDPSRWLRAWEQLEGYADASIDSISLDEELGYLTVVTLNLSSAVLTEQEVSE
jgi:type II secretory pathway pseudopilin PulG